MYIKYCANFIMAFKKYANELLMLKIEQNYVTS